MDTAQNPLQFMEFSQTVSMEICRYLQSGNISDQQLQELIGKKDDIKNIAKEIAHKYLQLVPEQILLAKELIERFYKEVFNHKLSLSKVVFPTQSGFSAYHFNTGRFDEDQIMEAYKKKWGIDLYEWMSLAANKIDHSKDQKRPKTPYPFAHVGGDETDTAHLGKSYDDAMAEKMIFANSVEYLLMTGLHKFEKDFFMDKKGWTRTSSLGSDGSFVDGCWDDSSGELGLSSGHSDNRISDIGPRQLIL